MAKLYVIHDSKLKVDLVPFLHHVEGAAINHFVTYAQQSGHSDFKLFSIMEFDYSDNSSTFVITDVDRLHIMDAPVGENGDD